MKGSKFLKVTGILMIISAAFGIIGGIIALIGAGALAAVLETSAGGLMLASALILVSAVFQLIDGIMGVKNCDKPEKAQSCMVCNRRMSRFRCAVFVVHGCACRLQDCGNGSVRCL